jgi:hypothetical protein
MQNKHLHLFMLFYSIKDLESCFQWEICIIYEVLGGEASYNAVHALKIASQENKNIDDINILKDFLNSIDKTSRKLLSWATPSLYFHESELYNFISSCIGEFYNEYNNPKTKLHLTVYKGGK